jgi:NAD+ synthase
MNKEAISDWISDYAKKNGIKQLVIGVSGGIDSAVTSTLAAETGLPTVVVSMPIHQNENQVSLQQEHIKWLKGKYSNVSSYTFNLTDTYESFKSTLTPYINDLSLANTRARLRMTTLYQVASTHSGIVVGTGNKVEDFGVGFYTKYGDGGVDISPIADLMKSEVFALGKSLGIITGILEAAPTDGLWGDDRTDEDQLGASYDELEWAMEWDGKIEELNKRELEVLDIFRTLNNNNRHKMEPIPIFINK